jgi:hypothetical protein
VLLIQIFTSHWQFQDVRPTAGVLVVLTSSATLGIAPQLQLPSADRSLWPLVANAVIGSLVSGVHHFYDFAPFRIVCSPLCFDLLAALAGLRAAHLDPGVPHPGPALLPITPMH